MAKNKDRDPSEMILGTFRVRAGMWEHFKQLASDNNATATDLILSFIENCLQSQSIPQSNLDDIYTYIDSKLDSKLDNTPSIQNIEDLIDSRIGGSIADGDIKSAIAHSYQSSINQFNGHLEELQQQIAELKKQMEELQSVPAAIDNSPAPELEIPPNDMQNIRSTLNRKKIRVRADEIRKAFYDAGWDGNNFQAVRKDILEILSGGK